MDADGKRDPRGSDMRAKYAFMVVLIGLFLCSTAFAQEYSIISQSTVIGRNTGYPTGTPRSELPDNAEGRTDVGNLDIVAESVFFGKNLEYGGKIDGQTFIGFLAPVRLRYRVHEQITFEAGAVLGHNYGDINSLDIIEPIVRLVYEPWRNSYVVAGTIIPTHWIHDALLDDVQKFLEPAEQGFQFRIDRKYLKNDTWINWRVREGELNSEQFEVGTSAQVQWRGLRVDLQGINEHTGGQLNSLHNTLNQTAGYVGGSLGTEDTNWFDKNSWMQEIRFHGGFLVSRNDELADKHGTGWEMGAYADLKVSERATLRPFASYFRGDNFVSPRGDILYSSYKSNPQYGVDAVFRLPAALCAEIGFTVHPNVEDLNYSFQVNLVWGRGFKILSPQ
jgi:hypothetical protein